MVEGVISTTGWWAAWLVLAALRSIYLIEWVDKIHCARTTGITVFLSFNEVNKTNCWMKGKMRFVQNEEKNIQKKVAFSSK